MSEEVRKGHGSEATPSSFPVNEGAVTGATDAAPESSSLFFTECRMVKYRNKFFELIEELRLRRDVNEQNEKKLCELLSLKHKLTQDVERQTQRLNEVLESHSHLEEETERRCSEQLRQLEEEKVKLNCLFEGKEKEFQALKDEIRALHMTKYSLEKKIGEQEYALQVFNVSQESYLSQCSQIEQQCVVMESKVNNVSKQLETLESNVREAIELNGKLSTANNHQQCVIDSYKRELDAFQKECINLKARLKAEEIAVEINDSTSINQQLRVEKEVVHQLQDQLSDLRVELCSVLQSLKEAHVLIDKHIDAASESATHESTLKERVSELTEEVDSLRKQLASQAEESTNKIQQFVSNSKQHKKETSELMQRLSTLQDDYTRLQSSNEELESDRKQLESNKAKYESMLEETKKQLNGEIQGACTKLLSIEKERDELKRKLAWHSMRKDTEDKSVQCQFVEEAFPSKRSPLSQDLLESPQPKRLKLSNEEEEGEESCCPMEDSNISKAGSAVNKIIVDIMEVTTQKDVEAEVKETMWGGTAAVAAEVKEAMEVVEKRVMDAIATGKSIEPAKVSENEDTNIQDLKDKDTGESAVEEVAMKNAIGEVTAIDVSPAPDDKTAIGSKTDTENFVIPNTGSKKPLSTTSTIGNVAEEAHSKTSILPDAGSLAVEIVFSDNDDDELIDTQLSREIEKAHSLLLHDRLKRSKSMSFKN